MTKISSYYLCDDLDCGFHFSDKYRPHHPVLELEIPVIDLNKKVKIKFVGFGEAGRNVLIDHGHEDHIFPVNLFDKPFRIDPKPSKKFRGRDHENWLKLIAYHKGQEHISYRKEYVLISPDGQVGEAELLSEEELKSKQQWQEQTWERLSIPIEKRFKWCLAEEVKC